jgi:ArsR family transcriptional regulator, arsenate/arsenite/antimonite-responsive transcriptional repressor / arsenate reductase (thioredoxin)
MTLETRAQTHAALGDSRRLLIVDELALGDRTVAELAESVGLKGNLLAHHLDVLETTGLIKRRVSEGDRRRRYVSLQWERMPSGPRPVALPIRSIAFICTQNSARSQFAAALWKQTTDSDAESAGSQPASRVHPTAVRVASEFGVDLSKAEPAGYERITTTPDLVISVCDLARESGIPHGRESLHWSVPDPVPDGSLQSFRTAFADIAQRVDHLAERNAPD